LVRLGEEAGKKDPDKICRGGNPGGNIWQLVNLPSKNMKRENVCTDCVEKKRCKRKKIKGGKKSHRGYRVKRKWPLEAVVIPLIFRADRGKGGKNIKKFSFVVSRQRDVEGTGRVSKSRKIQNVTRN